MKNLVRNGVRWLQRGGDAYLFILPAFAFYGLFIMFPVIQNFYFSLFQWSAIDRSTKTWVGFANFARLWADPIFWKSTKNTILFVLGTTVLQLTLSLALAAILESRIKFKQVFRTIFFMPVVISAAAVGLLFLQIYHPTYGLINEFLKAVGLPGLTRAWLGQPSTALFAVVVASAWQFAPLSMVLLLAGLQDIPEVLYEAAVIDGANAWHTFKYVTIPMLKPVLVMTVVLHVMKDLKVFDIIYTMTAGGPYYATEVLATYMYRKAFYEYSMGYGSTVATALFLLIFILTLVQLRVTKFGEQLF